MKIHRDYNPEDLFVGEPLQVPCNGCHEIAHYGLAVTHNPVNGTGFAVVRCCPCTQPRTISQAETYIAAQLLFQHDFRYGRPHA